MYKVLVVDDERLIREGIGEAFESQGDFEVHYAIGGVDALNIFETEHIDVILVDIVMPGMDGITLLKQLPDVDKKLIKVVISGYDKFEYAQAAVQNQAVEYLLKPCSPDKIEALAEKIADMLKTRDIREKDYQEKLEKGRKYSELAKEILLKSSITGGNLLEGLPAEQLETLFERDAWYCVMVLCDAEELYSGKEVLYANILTITNVLKEMCKETEQMYLCDDSSGMFTIVAFGTEAEIRNTCVSFFERTEEKLLENDIKICGGIGSTVEKPARICASFYEAIRVLQYNKKHNREGILFIQDVEPGFSDNVIHLYHEELVSALVSRDKEGVNQVVEKICAQLREKEHVLSIEYVNYSFIQLVSTSVLALADMSYDGFLHINQEYANCIQEVVNAHTVPAKVLWFKKFTDEVLEAALTYGKKREKTVVKKVKQYISENYQNEIELEKIALQLQLSKYYISRLFKEDEGTNFNEYVNRYRVSIAKKLLKETDMRIFEVADAVGYKNEYYFSITFKKIVGISPIEYRKSKQV